MVFLDILAESYIKSTLKRSLLYGKKSALWKPTCSAVLKFENIAVIFCIVNSTLVHNWQKLKFRSSKPASAVLTVKGQLLQKSRKRRILMF